MRFRSVRRSEPVRAERGVEFPDLYEMIECTNTNNGGLLVTDGSYNHRFCPMGDMLWGQYVLIACCHQLVVRFTSPVAQLVYWCRATDSQLIVFAAQEGPAWTAMRNYAAPSSESRFGLPSPELAYFLGGRDTADRSVIVSPLNNALCWLQRGDRDGYRVRAAWRTQTPDEPYNLKALEA